MKQLSFIPKTQLQYGGTLTHRKIARTLDSKRPLHLVLKSKNHMLLKYKKLFYSVLCKQARTFGIKIYSSSLQRDHFHLCIRITNRQLYRGFIRALTGILARKLGKGLWRFLPYTRIINWHKDFKNTIIYIFKNNLDLIERHWLDRAPPFPKF